MEIHSTSNFVQGLLERLEFFVKGDYETINYLLGIADCVAARDRLLLSGENRVVSFVKHDIVGYIAEPFINKNCKWEYLVDEDCFLELLPNNIEPFNIREWLNDKKHSSTGSIVCYSGPSPWIDKKADKPEHMRVVEVADCHNKVRIHQTDDETIEHFIKKINIMIDTLTEYRTRLELEYRMETGNAKKK